MPTLKNGGRPLDLLLVEDSAGDVRLIREAFREINSNAVLHVVSDGVEALAFLRQEGNYAHVRRPDIVLLDMHLPKMDGHEVLKCIKADAALNTMPVVVLTSSDDERNVLRAYDTQATCFLAKPRDLDTFASLIANFYNFWQNAMLPINDKRTELR